MGIGYTTSRPTGKRLDTGPAAKHNQRRTANLNIFNSPCQVDDTVSQVNYYLRIIRNRSPVEDRTEFDYSRQGIRQLETSTPRFRSNRA